MADGAGGDLADGGAGAGQAGGVIVGGQVADQRGHAVARAQLGHQAFEQRGLARAWARDQTHYPNAGGAEALAQAAGEQVVFLEDLAADFEDARGVSLQVIHGQFVHAAISSCVISISSPRTMRSAGEPHWAQPNAG